MTISLTWSRYEGNPPPHKQTVVLQDEGTIGRANNNDFVIFDPANYCSRNHANIFSQGGKYYIEDTSGPGTKINSVIKLSRGQKYELREKDTIEVGDCVLLVDYIDVQNVTGGDYTSPRTLGREATKIPPRAAPSGNSPAVGSDTFNIEDFFNDPNSYETHGHPEVAATNLTNLTVDEIFESENLYETAEPQSDGARIDEIFSDSMHNQMSDHNTQSESDNTDSHRHVIDNSNRPGAINNDTLALRAFLAELELMPEQFVGQNKVEIMRVAGEVLRTLTEGMMGVLSARDAVKQQLGMDRTQINGVKNNPLKFSASPQEALGKMLTQEAGYLDPISSANEAVKDAKAHQIAMISGISATVKETVTSFDPVRIEKEFEAGFVFGNKRAKYWDMYTEKYSKIAKDIESGTSDMFSEHFREHYEKQFFKIR